MVTYSYLTVSVQLKLSLMLLCVFKPQFAPTELIWYEVLSNFIKTWLNIAKIFFCVYPNTRWPEGWSHGGQEPSSPCTVRSRLAACVSAGHAAEGEEGATNYPSDWKIRKLNRSYGVWKVHSTWREMQFRQLELTVLYCSTSRQWLLFKPTENDATTESSTPLKPYLLIFMDLFSLVVYWKWFSHCPEGVLNISRNILQ